MTTFCYIISIFWVLSHYIYLCGLVLINILQINKLLIIAISVVMKEALGLVCCPRNILCLCACSVAPVVSDSLWLMDCSPPGSSVHGILQARILEWVAMPSSRGSSQPRDGTQVSYNSCTEGRFFTTEPQGKLHTLSPQTKMFQCAWQKWWGRQGSNTSLTWVWVHFNTRIL